MNCCANCFIDGEVIAFIKTQSTQNGDCDICKCANTQIIPCSELLDIFQDLFAAYDVVQEGSPFSGQLLYLNLKEWNLFNNELVDADVEKLVREIGSSIADDNPNLFTEATAPKVLLVTGNQEEAQQYSSTWNNFKDEIKSTNRFFIKNQFELEKVKDIFKSYERIYNKEKRFYRARNSDRDGLNKELMGKPPAHLATPGRANPKGISYLYLANDIKTTLYEVRAAIYDYVTVATFKLVDTIKIVSLRHNTRISPFQIDDLDKFLLYEQFVQSLHNDLKKPLRRQDSELEYLPTQYLCELIKYLGYDGIEYSSSMNPAGFNVALFDDTKTECIDCQIFEVDSINYNYIAVNV